MIRSVLRIGEIARLLGVTPKTVRHYHKLGLLPEPKRSESGYRLYSTADLFHLRRIRRLQSLGLSLLQIQFILDADDPDALLRTTLEGLQNELAAQQQRIEARRQRIERYLAEGVSLREVEQPENPSLTYQHLQAKLSDLPALPEGLIRFDQQVFTDLDAFDWGEGYHTTLQSAVEQFASSSEDRGAYFDLVQKFVALQGMDEDDPQIQAWAEEIRQSGLMQALASTMPETPQLAAPISEVMKQIFIQSADQHLNGAQRRFLNLLLTQP